MASAVVTRVTQVVPDGTGVALEMEVIFAGDGVRAGGDISLVSVALAAGDTPATMRSKMSTAVAGEATRLGYPLATNAMVLPSFQRG